jgi:hypothetical protein
MPGDRELHVLDAEGEEPWRRLDLPSFSVGDEPLRGPNNLFTAGPWLGVCYAKGIEVYSTEVALSALAAAAEDPLHRADLLVQAGRMPEALEVVTAMFDGELAPEVRGRAATKAVALARELALREGTVAPLDRVGEHMQSRPVRLAWHLARLDFYQRTDDLRSYQEEQQRLYRVMEGKD